MAVRNHPDNDDHRQEEHEEQCRRRQIIRRLAEHDRRVRDEGPDYWKHDMEEDDDE